MTITRALAVDEIPYLTVLFVHCAICSAWISSCRGVVRARSWLASVGWVERGDDNHFECPACAKGGQGRLL